MRTNHLSVGLFVVFFTLAAAHRAQAQPAGASASPGSHLTFVATAHTVAAGHGYFEMALGLFPRFQVGVTDRVSLGAGTVAVYPRLVYLTPKVQLYRSAATSAAVGVFHVAGLTGFSGGVAYSVVTHDRPRRDDGARWSFTGGAGMAYGNNVSDGHRTTGRQLVGMFGAEHGQSSRTTETIEGYVHSRGALVIVGHRRQMTRWWVNTGIMFAVPALGIPAPIISFSRQF